MPWKPEVFVEGRWSQNRLVFATQEEAENNAHDLFMRWFLCVDSRAVEVNEAVNATYHDRKLEMLGDA